MTVKSNLYWQVYKNLEKEVLDITNSIYFSDDQLKVYSLKNAELIMRAAIEIESIAKSLYEQNGGKKNPDDDTGNNMDLFFDTDCLNFLEINWKLSKKRIYVTSPYFYFDKEENIILTPLYKANRRGTSGADWKQAYQAIKHNRADNIKRANIKNLLRIMAALYLLNIYHKDESIFLGKDSATSSVPSGSDIFSVDTISVEMTKPDNSVDISLSYFQDTISAVYMVKIAEEFTVKQVELMNTLTILLNKKIAELSSMEQFNNLDDLTIKAMQLLPKNEINKVYTEADFEAVTVKPERINFYKSQDCLSKYTKEQLVQIEEDAKIWKKKTG